MFKKQLGLSLVELMIAVALGIVLMTGVVNMFLSSKVVFSTQQGMSRIQETGRLAIEFLSRDIRMAAYFGCFRPDPTNDDLDLQNKTMVIGGLHGNFGEGIRGYDSIESLPNGQSDVGAGITPLDDSHTANVLVVRSANQIGLPISAPNNPNSIFAYSATGLVNNCISTICVGTAVVVSDCYRARVFQVSALSHSGETVTLSHSDTWGGGSDPKENFISGELLSIFSTVYFIAEGASGAPSLWQRTNNGTALELLEGVEHMRITYSYLEDDDDIPDEYVPASAVPLDMWPKVVSVRIELVVRSLENNVLAETQPYTFAGAEITPPDIDGVPDRYMRQVFSATVGIRSRASNIE